jgi:hypothetical protein
LKDYAYVAYLDILGYRQYLEHDVNSGSLDFKDKMTRAFRVFENVNSLTFSHEAISDSIFVTCSTRELAREFLEVIRGVYCSFLNEGLLLRGGISYGAHFHAQSITYSSALAKAHLLESSVADCSRIVVDDNIVAMFEDLANSPDLLLSTGSTWFLNIVTKDNWDSLWAAAKRAYEGNRVMIDSVARARSKHRWLQDLLISLAPASIQPDPYLPIFDPRPQLITPSATSTASPITSTPKNAE